ncbi:MAG TPA: choice-of-anchor V domain-containing protein [Bryobacteraceae bacterium]|nr:choice-of-anchor V domain-containing protein [Bryobacteraceae bacterium]
MESRRTIFIAKILGILAVIPLLVWAHAAGPDPGKTGVPGESTCAEAGCHTGAGLNQGGGKVTIDAGGTTYTPGVRQRIRVTVIDPTQRKWGFQVTARLASNPKTRAGVLSPSDATTQVLCSGANTLELPCTSNPVLQFIEHTLSGSRQTAVGAGQTFEFDWTPPDSDVGSIVLYAAGNAANANTTETGDNIYTTSVTLTAGSAPPPTGSSTTQIISHIADGARWKTTVILVNLDTVPAPFTLNFWKDDGSAFPISLTGRGTQAVVTDTIPAGGSRTIETDGTAAALGTGWAELISSQAVSGTAVFRDQTLGQEAAVPLLVSGGSRLMLPFDTGGLALGVALANPSANQDAVVTRTLRNGAGQVISTDSLTVAKHGHTSFLLSNSSTKPEDQRGVVEFSSPQPIYALGIRSSGGAFTSIEALGQVEAKNKVISHIANGARWKTTIILVNTDSAAAQFTVNFWKDDGSAFSVSLVGGGTVASVTGTIPAGGSTTIETDGLAAELTTGWAEVLSAQAIGGAAIFRDQTLRQEAGVPLLANGGTRLLLPFQSGTDLGVALANASASQDAGITRTLRNEQGQLILSDALMQPRRAHSAFLLANPSSKPEDQRGVVEFSSSVEFFSLGIRGNNGAFTSVRALSK